MNSKLLYAATVAVSLISTLAMADEAPLTREQVKAEVRQAMADGTLPRTDYDGSEWATRATVSTKSREQVGVELAQNRTARKALVGPLTSSNYNQFGLQVLQTSTLARPEVKQEVRDAIANGTLPRTDYDDPVLLARQHRAHTASATLAQRFKAKFSNGS
ncbi:MAG TPA: DUF4148 domain-containing protein [Burkholderiaceae bacterium]|nr:DUF4148 domain-containing protein [Burkholderiaceae bacterium]